MHLNARCVQGRCCTFKHRNQHSWLAVSWISHESMGSRGVVPLPACWSVPQSTPRTIGGLLWGSSCRQSVSGSSFAPTVLFFCQWIREIHCLFVHQTALVHRAPCCWKAASLQRMYQLVQGKAMFSVNCKKDSLITGKKIPFPSRLFPPPLPQLPLLFLSQMLLPSLVWILFLPASLLLGSKTWDSPWCLLIHGIWTSFSLTPLEHNPSLLLFLITLPWKMAFSAPPFFSPHSCSSFSLYIIPEMSGFMCFLWDSKGVWHG